MNCRYSRVLERLAKNNPDKIQEYFCEGENGHFLYLVYGWKCVSTDCGTVRENTVKQVLECFRCIRPLTEEELHYDTNH